MVISILIQTVLSSSKNIEELTQALIEQKTLITYLLLAISGLLVAISTLYLNNRKDRNRYEASLVSITKENSETLVEAIKENTKSFEKLNGTLQTKKEVDERMLVMIEKSMTMSEKTFVFMEQQTNIIRDLSTSVNNMNRELVRISK